MCCRFGATLPSTSLKETPGRNTRSKKPLSSAGSPVGFSVEQVRKMIGMTHGYDIRYLHLPEGAVKLANGREDPGTAKLLATLAVDFMKAHTH